MVLRSEDLMLGDWVQGYLPDTSLKVVGIPSEYRLAVVTSDRTYMELSIDDCQPIPLTPEILEKNGFEYERNVGYVYDNYEGIIITCSTFISRLKIIKDLNILYDSQDYADIYMHTIQHALRLCGIEKPIVL